MDTEQIKYVCDKYEVYVSQETRIELRSTGGELLGFIQSEDNCTPLELADRVSSWNNRLNRLAIFIMENIPGEPSEDEGCVDCAIRLLKRAYLS